MIDSNSGREDSRSGKAAKATMKANSQIRTPNKSALRQETNDELRNQKDRRSRDAALLRTKMRSRFSRIRPGTSWTPGRHLTPRRTLTDLLEEGIQGGAIEQSPVGHHGVDSGDGPDILERIRVQDDEIGHHAWSDDAE